MALRVLILGAAAGGGFPQWNCACRNCAAYWRGDSGYSKASQSSIAVSADGENWVLLNASPDLRGQIIDNPAMQPNEALGLRDSPIKAVVLTNGDVDHVAGLLTLRESQPFDLYGTGEILGILNDNPVFSAVNPEFAPRKSIRLDESFEPVAGLTFTLFAVPGKVPLYLEGAEVRTDLVGEQTVGVEIVSGGDRAYYIPGCAAAPADLLQRVDGAALLMFDGTTWTDDEMMRESVGVKTAGRMGHMHMSGPDGSIAAWAGTRAGRKVYTHINNTNPVFNANSAERAEAEAAGWEIAHDGMEITL